MKATEEQKAESHRRRSREYYYRNREKRIVATQDWRKGNEDKVNANARRSRLKCRIACLEHYSNGKMCCACCGENRIEFLGIDHIKGGGNRERKEMGHGNIYQRLKVRGYPEGHRVLCHNCNMSLGFYGYCPHQKERENEK